MVYIFNNKKNYNTLLIQYTFPLCPYLTLDSLQFTSILITDIASKYKFKLIISCKSLSIFLLSFMNKNNKPFFNTLFIFIDISKSVSSR